MIGDGFMARLNQKGRERGNALVLMAWRRVDERGPFNDRVTL